jgi:hypothetical protein
MRFRFENDFDRAAQYVGVNLGQNKADAHNQPPDTSGGWLLLRYSV